MRKTTCFAILVSALVACNNAKKQENALKDTVLNFHEQVMADDEKAMISKMKLDTLIHKADSLHADTIALSKLSADLVKADNAMTDWMSKLKVDYTDNDHNKVMEYWQDQQKQVKGIDSMLIKATQASAAHMSKIKKQ